MSKHVIHNYMYSRAKHASSLVQYFYLQLTIIAILFYFSRIPLVYVCVPMNIVYTDEHSRASSMFAVTVFI